jgi:hypothetical protein
MDALTLEDAVALLAAKSGKSAGRGRGARSREATSAVIPKMATTKSSKVATAKSKAIRKNVAGKPKAAKPPAKTAIRKRAV